MRNTKRLFLQWALTNVVTIAIIWFAVTFAASHVPNISAIAIGMAGIIGLIYCLATQYAGILSWKVAIELEKDRNNLQKLQYLRHSAQHISFAAHICPFIGLIGALGGILFFMANSTTLDASHLKEVMSNSMSGIGIAFIPTIVGVFCMIVLSVQYHLITHSIGYLLKDEVST